MLEYQGVIQEQEELISKITKLSEFINGKNFSTINNDEQDRLKRQRIAMTEYADILEERISNF
jgi:hypothetical protein